MIATTIGLVEDSDEDYAAFARVLGREAPDTKLIRWPHAEAFLATLSDDASRDSWPQVLVIDLSLPGIDGCELVTRLRANPATASVPAFILSGSDRQSDIDRCYAAGANAYLTKPGNIAELRALLQMLLRSIASFKAPTPLASTPPPEPAAGAAESPPSDPVVVDQASIDRHRDEYERRLIEERDAERRGRRRAEALQRLTSRLADATDADQIDGELVRAASAGDDGRTARVERTGDGEPAPETMVMPDPFGAGTIAILPLVTERGTAHGALRVDLPGELGDDDEAFLHAAASLGRQALSRLARQATRNAPRADGAGDLPSLAWWREATDRELASCNRSGTALTALAIELEDLAAYSAAHGHVAADHLLLALADCWRTAGFDLLAPFGDERFATLVSGHTAAQTADIIRQVSLTFDADHAFVVGLAQWNRREDADGLLARAQADLAARRRAR